MKIQMSILVSLVFLSVSSHSRPAYLGQLTAAYGHNLPNRCNTCHQTNSLAFNSFGKDYVATRAKFGKQMDVFWKELGALDSDKDGISNLDEINQDRNPGVAGK